MPEGYRMFNKEKGEIRCGNCGKMFTPSKPYFRTCYSCHLKQQKQTSFPSDLLLQDYYDNNGNLVKEVFIGIPQQIADILAKDGLKPTQLRDFYALISRARNKSVLKGIDCVRPILWECQKKSAYQAKRGIIRKSFVCFLEHHLSIAEKNEKNLEGFYQHFDSVVCYFPKKKGGSQ